MPGTAEATEGVPAERRRVPTGLLRRPPGPAFHAALVAVGLAVLWAFSFPGVNVLALVICFWIVVLAGLIWVVRAVAYLVARRRALHHGSALWFAVAPLGSLVLAVVVAAHVPLRVRWQTSKADFELAVADVRAQPGQGDRRHRERVGTYTITTARVVGEGVLFYESVGSLFDYAGFAYLPDDASREIAEEGLDAPEWFPLGDGWYAWTAGS